MRNAMTPLWSTSRAESIALPRVSHRPVAMAWRSASASSGLASAAVSRSEPAVRCAASVASKRCRPTMSSIAVRSARTSSVRRAAAPARGAATRNNDWLSIARRWRMRWIAGIVAICGSPWLGRNNKEPRTEMRTCTAVPPWPPSRELISCAGVLARHGVRQHKCPGDQRPLLVDQIGETQTGRDLDGKDLLYVVFEFHKGDRPAADDIDHPDAAGALLKREVC